MSQPEKQVSALIAAYAEEAETNSWFGPEVVFGLSYTYDQPDQKVLDIGISTGNLVLLVSSREKAGESIVPAIRHLLADITVISAAP